MGETRMSEDAAGWLMKLEEDSSPECKAAFAAWASRSPAHMEEFLLVTAAYRELDGLDPQHTLEVDLQSLTTSGEHKVRRFPMRLFQSKAPFRDSGSVVSALPRRKRVAAVAAIVSVIACGAVAAWTTLRHTTVTRTYSTGLGEQRAIKLGDDSVVQLNTRSRVEVQLTKEAREVRLLEGEALFAVEDDPTRPFRVMTGGAVIQAIGTQFNVYRQVPDSASGPGSAIDPDDRADHLSGMTTTVAVVQGVVKISTPVEPGQHLLAGQEAVIEASGQVRLRAVAEVSRSIAWRQRKLDFRGAPLEEVAREFNRYNRMQIQIEDPAIARRQLNGVFNADEPDSLVEFLTEEPEVRIRKLKDEIVIGRR